MFADLHGPLNTKGCNKNVFPSGMVIVGVPSVVPHASLNAFKKAYSKMSNIQFKIVLDLRSI